MTMNTTSTLDPASFVAPGPGTWLLDAVHVSRPFTRFQAEIHPPNLKIGFRESTRRYGLLIDTLDWRIVNGFAYFQPSPVADAEVPARLEAAAEALGKKVWRVDLERWEQSAKPTSIQAHLVLQSVDPSTLGHDELLDYVDRCREHLARMIQQHHIFSVPAFLVVGDFIAHAGEWAGLPLGEALALIRGAAPASAGASSELDRLIAAIRANAGAQAILAADVDAGEALERLRGMAGEVGANANAYLDLVGYRLLDGFDVGDPYALEMPQVLVNDIREDVEVGAPKSSSASEEELAGVRERVPAEQRDIFDELLAEARHMSRLRDERGLYSDEWAGGIMRRAIMAAGARLAEQGRLAEPGHLAEAGYREMRALIQGDGGPTAEELASRASYAPPFLGPPPSAPPSLDGLPMPAARLMRAIGAGVDALFGGGMRASEATMVRGIGASPGVYTGVARRIDGPAEFDRLRHGDVLVTASTTESFNIVVPLLGAVVTDAGGLLSHAAIVSREFGIPSVVGCGDATTLIADGARVRVDGTNGEVAVIGP
jgi:pyruvate,water dikinase